MNNFQLANGKHKAQIIDNNPKVYKFLLPIICALILGISIIAAVTIGYADDKNDFNNDPISVNVAQSETKTLYAPFNNNSYNTYQWSIFVPSFNDFVEIAGANADSLDVDATLLKNAVDDNNATIIKAAVLDSEGNLVREQNYNINYIDDIDEAALPASLLASNLASQNTEGGTTISFEQDPLSDEADANETKKITVKFVDMNGIPVALSNEMEIEADASGKTAPFTWSVQLKDYLGVPQSDIAIEPAGEITAVLAGENNQLNIKSTGGISQNITVTIKFRPGTATYAIDCYYENADGTMPKDQPSKTVTDRSGLVGSTIPNQSDVNFCYPESKYPDSWEVTAVNLAEITQDGSAHCTIAYGRLFSLVFFNTNGGIDGPKAIFARYGSAYTEQPKTPKMAGSIFEGWYDNPDFKGDPITTFSTIPPVNTTYYAKFTVDPKTTRDVTIIYWGENANANTSEFDKDEYSYLTERKIEATYNTQYNLTEDLVIPPYTEKFQTDDEWKRLYKCSSLSDLADYDKNVHVEVDNTTVVNVYLYRQWFTWKFYRNVIFFRASWEITAKWDEDVYDSDNAETKKHFHGDGFKQVCEDAFIISHGVCSWRIGDSDDILNYMSHMTDFDYDDDSTKTGAKPTLQYVLWDFDDTVPFRYYTQDVDGVYENHKSIETAGEQEGFTIEHTATLLSSRGLIFVDEDNYFTDKDYVPIYGFKAPNPDGINGPKTDGTVTVGGVSGGYSVYYIRNKHNVHLNRISANTNDAENQEILSGVHYEKKLGDINVPEDMKGTFTDPDNRTLKNFIPENPGGDNIDSNLVFAGWTYDTNGLGETVDLNDTYLPDDDISLYAKWVEPKVTITFVYPKSPTENEVPDPAHPEMTIVMSDLQYGKYIADYPQYTIPETRSFSDEGYELIARYYYETPEDKAAGNKTYFHPKEMTIPSHDVEIYTEYTTANISQYTIKYMLKKTSSEEEDVFVAADRSGVGYVGDTVTLYPKTSEELYFDYRSFYIPSGERAQIVMDEDYQKNIVVFEYELLPTASLDYTVYYLNDHMLDPEKPDEIPADAIIDKKEVKNHRKNFTTETARDDFVGFTLSSKSSNTLTSLLGSDASKNIIKFYYDEATQVLNYKIKLDRTIVDPVVGQYELSIYSQEVYVKTNLVKGTKTAPLCTAIPTSPYIFTGWTINFHGEERSVENEKQLDPYLIEGEMWTSDNSTFYANFTNGSTVTATFSVAEDSTGKGSVSETSVTVANNSNYEIYGTTIYLFGTDPRIDVVASPNDTYAFAYWTIDEETDHLFDDQGTFTKGISFKAHFVDNAVKVSFKQGSHATMSIGPTTISVPSGTEYSINSDNGTFDVKGYLQNPIKLTIADYYHYNSWAFSEEQTTEGKFDRTTDVTPIADIDQVDLQFKVSKENKGYTSETSLTVDALSKYSVEADNSLTITSTVNPSKTNKITVTTEEGFKFTQWINDASFTEFTITRNATFTALLDYQTFDLTFSASPSDKGSVSRQTLTAVPYWSTYKIENNNLVITYPYEESPQSEIITQSPVPDSHYHFTSWTVSDQPVTSGVVKGTMDFVANFKIDKVNIKIKPNNTEGGKIDGADLVSMDVDYGTKFNVATGETPSITIGTTTKYATANEHYSFTLWKYENGEEITSEQIITANCVVIGQFDIDKFTLKFVNNSTHGTMSHDGETETSFTLENVPYNTEYYMDAFGTINVVLNARDTRQYSQTALTGFDINGWTQKIGGDEPSPVDYTQHYNVEDNIEFETSFLRTELNIKLKLSGEYADGGTLDKTELKLPYETTYKAGRDGIEKGWITFSDPTTNEEVTVTCTPKEGYFWDGWYISDTEQETKGKITKERSFYPVFWMYNDTYYLVNHHLQNLKSDGTPEEDHGKWPVVQEKIICTTGAVRTPAYYSDSGYYPITAPKEIVVKDDDLIGGDGPTICDYEYTLNQYNLLVNYNVPEGYDAPDPVEDTLYYTANYSYESPAIEGLEADMHVVSGTMPHNDVVVTVNYSVPVPPSPDNPENINAQTGDSNFWIIVGLIAIVVIAGGAAFVVARRKKNNTKPKH